MAAGPGLAPHRPPFEDFAGTSGQAGSSTAGSFALVLCCDVGVHIVQSLRQESWLGPNVPESLDGSWLHQRIAKKSRDTN